MIFSSHFTNLSYVFLAIFIQELSHSLFLIYFLSIFPFIRMIDRDRHRLPMCIFHFILVALAVSIVSFRSPHLREWRKSERDRLLPSCRQELPIGIPRRRVGSATGSVCPAIVSEWPSVYAIARIVLLLKWRNNLSGSGRPRSSRSPSAPVSKKNS